MLWKLVKALLAKWAFLKWLLGSLGSLAVLLPIAALLAKIGLPLLIVLAIVALPLIILLAVLGLPLIGIAIVGGMIMALLSMVLMVGMVALKIFLFVVLPIMVVWWLFKWLFGWGRNGGPTSTDPATGHPRPDTA